MLYDPKWEKPADVYSLESLIAWLEKQPASKRYSFCNAQKCLIAQYLIENRVENYNLRSDEVRKLGWMEIVNPQNSGAATFGAALERARALANSQ